MDGRLQGLLRKMRQWADRKPISLPAKIDEIAKISAALEKATEEIHSFELRAAVDSYAYQRLQLSESLPSCVCYRIQEPVHPCSHVFDEYVPFVGGGETPGDFFARVFTEVNESVFSNSLLNYLPNLYRRELIKRLIFLSKGIRNSVQIFEEHRQEHMSSRPKTHKSIDQDPDNYPYEHRKFLNSDGVDPWDCSNQMQIWRDGFGRLGVDLENLAVECLAVCRLAIKTQLQEIGIGRGQGTALAANKAMKSGSGLGRRVGAPKGSPGRKPDNEKTAHAEMANRLKSKKTPPSWKECACIINTKFGLSEENSYNSESIRTLYRIRFGDKSQNKNRE